MPLRFLSAFRFVSVLALLALHGCFLPPARSAQPQTTCALPASTRLVPWRGGHWFLSGANVPWQGGGFGADFGTVEEWGQHTYSHAATGQMFARLKADGANTVRWWVFADGRGAPEFDALSGGSVTGFDSQFLPSLVDAIQLASQHNLYLVFNLWSFDMLYDDSTPAGRGEHAGGHRDLIVEAGKRQSFINNALTPMLQQPVTGTAYTVGTHPNVLGWDIVNEPEWGITESAAVNPGISQPVSLAEMQRFVAEVAAAIRQNSNQWVTLGSASMKWNSDGALGAVGNWWSDAALTPYAADGYLDFYQIHYYGWMNGDEVFWSYSPLFNSFADAGFDKPTVVGELPGNAQADTGHTLGALLDGLYDNCYAGAWMWSYYGVDGHGDWGVAQSAYQTFNAQHAGEISIAPFRVHLPLLQK